MSRSDRSQEGFSLVEVVISMAVMSLVATAIISVAMRVFTDTATIVDRRDVFTDARFAIDRMTKQLRQGETIDTLASTAAEVSFTTYIDGVPTEVVWRVDGTTAPFELQESRDGGAFVPVLSSLGSADVFTYTAHEDVTDQVTIDLSLVTNTSTVALTSDVYLRNAGAA